MVRPTRRSKRRREPDSSDDEDETIEELVRKARRRRQQQDETETERTDDDDDDDDDEALPKAQEEDDDEKEKDSTVKEKKSDSKQKEDTEDSVEESQKESAEKEDQQQQPTAPNEEPQKDRNGKEDDDHETKQTTKPKESTKESNESDQPAATDLETDPVEEHHDDNNNNKDTDAAPETTSKSDPEVAEEQKESDETTTKDSAKTDESGDGVEDNTRDVPVEPSVVEAETKNTTDEIQTSRTQEERDDSVGNIGPEEKPETATPPEPAVARNQAVAAPLETDSSSPEESKPVEVIPEKSNEAAVVAADTAAAKKVGATEAAEIKEASADTLEPMEVDPTVETNPVVTDQVEPLEIDTAETPVETVPPEAKSADASVSVVDRKEALPSSVGTPSNAVTQPEIQDTGASTTPTTTEATTAKAESSAPPVKPADSATAVPAGDSTTTVLKEETKKTASDDPMIIQPKETNPVIPGASPKDSEEPKPSTTQSSTPTPSVDFKGSATPKAPTESTLMATTAMDLDSPPTSTKDTSSPQKVATEPPEAEKAAHVPSDTKAIDDSSDKIASKATKKVVVPTVDVFRTLKPNPAVQAEIATEAARLVSMTPLAGITSAVIKNDTDMMNKMPGVRMIGDGHVPRKAKPAKAEAVAIRSVDLEGIKSKIFDIGSRVHGGKGYEKTFSQYWKAMALRLHSNLPTTEMSRALAVINSFLRTKLLRKLHNRLILGIIRNSLETNVQEADIPANTKRSIRRKIVHVRPQNQELETYTVLEQDGKQVDTKTTAGDAAQKRDDLPPMKLGTCITAPIQVSDEIVERMSTTIPGAMSVEAKMYKLVGSMHRNVGVNVDWLIVVAVREFVKTLLENVLASKKALEDGRHPPKAAIRSQILPRKRSAQENKPPIALRGPERKRITAQDIHLVVSRMSVTPRSATGCITRPTFESSLFSSYDYRAWGDNGIYGSVRKFMVDQILKIPEPKPVPKPTKEMAVTKLVPSPITTDTSPTKMAKPNDQSATKPPEKPPLEQSPAKLPGKPPERRPLTQESSTGSVSSRRGLGRGAKNLAAMLQRSTSVSKITSPETPAAAQPAAASTQALPLSKSASATSLPSPNPAAASPVPSPQKVNPRRGMGLGSKDLKAMMSRSMIKTSEEAAAIAKAVGDPDEPATTTETTDSVVVPPPAPSTTVAAPPVEASDPAEKPVVSTSDPPPTTKETEQASAKDNKESTPADDEPVNVAETKAPPSVVEEPTNTTDPISTTDEPKESASSTTDEPKESASSTTDEPKKDPSSTMDDPKTDKQDVAATTNDAPP